jgi:hypothetical protein
MFDVQRSMFDVFRHHPLSALGVFALKIRVNPCPSVVKTFSIPASRLDNSSFPNKLGV